MNFLKQAWDVCTFNKSAIHSAEKTDIKWPLIVVAIGGALAGVYGGIIGIISLAVGAVILSFIWTFILFLFAKMFGGKASYMEYYKPLAYSSLLNWALIIPLLGLVIFVWRFIVAIVVTREVHKFSTGKAVFVVLLPALIIGVLVFIFMAMIAAVMAPAMLAAFKGGMMPAV